MKKTLGILMLLIAMSSMYGMTYTLFMQDGYGDGWDGATVDLKVNDTQVITGATVTGENATRTFSVESHDVITTVYNAANTYFNAEASYQILDDTGAIAIEDGATGIPEGITYTVPIEGLNVTYVAPVNKATDIALENTELTWTLGSTCSTVDLYFSTDEALVESMDESAKVIHNQNVTSYSCETMDFLTNYYWRVVAHNEDDSASFACAVELFTTSAGEGVVNVHVGDGEDTSYEIPFCTFNNVSLCETIYLASDLNITGQIKGLSYFNQNTETFDFPIKLWVGETELDSVSTNIGIDELTLVYDSETHFPAGDNQLNFVFNEPFDYHGGNLVVLSYRPRTEESTLSTNRYFYTETQPGRTKYWTRFGDLVIDPENIPEEGTLTNKVPNANFYVDAGTMGTIEGVVTYDGSGLEGAKVSIDGTNLFAMTDEDGNYSFANTQADTGIVLTASKHGFVSASSEAFDLGAGATVTVPAIDIVSEPRVAVSGAIVSNTGNAIENAVVVLNGYDFQFIGTYNDDQSFSFDNIYTGHDYEIVVYAENYQIYSETITVGDDALVIDHDLTIKEICFPVKNLTMTSESGSVTLNWDEPLTEVGDECSDSFEEAGTFEVISNNERSWQRVGTLQTMIGDIAPTDGAHQMQCAYGESAQDEWLISPTMNCPNGYLVFDWYGPYNATDGDHYYVKVSNNDGATWDVIWDGSNVVVDDPENVYNNYDEPIVINIDEYAGSEVKFAWQNVSSNGCNGMTLLDNIRFGVKYIPGRVVAPVNRSFQNTYNVYRYNHLQENNPEEWTLVGDSISERTFTDDTTSLGGGFYRYVVKSIYTDNEESASVKTDWNRVVEQKSVILITKSSEDQSPIGPVLVKFTATVANPDNTYDEYSATTAENGYENLDDVNVGTYNVVCYADGFASSNQEIEVTSDGENMFTFLMDPSEDIIHDDFERYDDFAISFGDWILQDNDLAQTYGVQGYDWPGKFQQQAFIVFNPFETTPPSDNKFEANSGEKFLASFSIQEARSNDILFSKPFSFEGDCDVKFSAKTGVPGSGVEEFNVYVCPNGTTSLVQSVCISGETPVQTTDEFVEYTYSIPSEYQRTDVRVALQCVSNDVFMFAVDDFIVSGTEYSANEDNNSVPVVTSLCGNYPNPFNPETTIKYNISSKASNVKLNIYNIRGQKVKTLVNEEQNAGTHTIVWNGLDNSNKSVASGVYFYKLTTKDYSSTKKMILLK